MINRGKKDPNRAEKIMKAALKVAESVGYMMMQRNEVAHRAKCATGLVSKYYGDVDSLRHTVLERAVEDENLIIVSQALAMRHPVAMKAPVRLKKKAAQQLLR